MIRSLREHWQRRKRYRYFRNWLLALYNRALLRGWPLPGRGRVATVHLTCQARPVKVRLGTSDWLVLEEVFFDGEYAIANSYPNGSIQTVVDLGANVGYTVLFWKTLFPHAHVVAVEPDPGNMELCRQNVEGIAGVTLLEGCATAQSGNVVLDRSSGEAWAFRIGPIPAGSGSGTEPVRAYSMIELMQVSHIRGSIDLLKCDIEGAEAELFASCGQWIGGIRRLIVELHRPYHSSQFLEHLKSAGAVPDDLIVQDFGSHELLYATLPGSSVAPAGAT